MPFHKSASRNFIGLFLIFSSILFGAEQDQLRTQDIGKIMKQIFDEHIEQKTISRDIVKHALKVYVDQFDPYHVYLMESEVRPYTKPSPEELDQVIAQYKENNYTNFQQLNTTIQKSIERARLWRKEFEHNTQLLVVNAQQAREIGEWGEPDPQRPFAATPQELKERTRRQMIQYLNIQKRRYGPELVARQEGEALSQYEKMLRNLENAYLFRDKQGAPLSTKQQENLFAMHVLKALASSLDTHTKFYSQNEAYDMKVRLEKSLDGVGVILRELPEGFVIVGLVESSPAEKSSLIKVQDIIVEIDGKKVEGKPFSEILEMLRGKEGTTVALLLKRKAATSETEKLINVKLKREAIAIQSDRVDVGYEKFGNGIIGVVNLHGFYQGENGINSEKDVKDAIADLNQKGNLRGLILDLRNNSGGFLSQAVKVGGLFITNGIIVISKYGNGDQKIYRDVDSHISYEGPLIILTSKATASAAEIVAEALQDYGVALVVGDDRTFGKGTIQTQTVTEGNPDAPAYKVTIGEYFTVSGKTPQDRGVQADVVVPGLLSREQIGEEFTDHPIKAGKIDPEYNDKLSDVSAEAKPWYMKYYQPSVQQQVLYWRTLIPTLKKNSQYRIAQNKNYQLFLKGQNWKSDDDEGMENNEDDLTVIKGQKNFGVDDLQLIEGINVVKDMILLHAQEKAKGNPTPGPL